MLTTAAAVALMSVLYAGYARLMRPMLRSEVTRQANQSIPAPPVPSGLRELTVELLKWNGTPAYLFTRDDGRTRIVFNTAEKIGDPELGIVELRPFAFVTTDPERPEEPFVLQAQSARIRFDEFDLFEQKIGKILAGELSGWVEINGADGLHLNGQDFVLDDRNLYSDSTVSFQFGPSSRPSSDKLRVAGQADGVVLEFHTAEPGEPGLLGKDFPPIAGLKNLRLRRNVSLDILSDTSVASAPKAPDHIVIQCDGSAIYSVDSRIALFENNVRVAHSESAAGSGIDLPNTLHSLDGCDRLRFTLGNNGREDAAKVANFSLALELRSIEAIGQRLLLQAVEDDLIAEGERLFYDLIGREAVLSGGPVTPNRPPPLVVVQLDGQELRCPQTRVQTTDRNRLVRASFPGPGVLSTTEQLRGDQTSVPAIQANWEKEVVVEPVLSDSGRPQTRLTATGNVRLRLEQEATRLTAPNLVCWIDDQKQSSYRQLAGGSRDRNPLRRVLAKDGAHIVRPDLDVTASKMFELNLVPVAEVSNPIEQTSAQSPDAGDANNGSKPPSQSLTATARSIGLTLGVSQDDVELLGLTAETAVHIEQAGQLANDPPSFFMKGDRATLAGQGGEQRVTLTGGRAEIEVDGMNISAVQLTADRARGTIEVPGGGVITIPMDGDLGQIGGNTSESVVQSDEPLKVVWNERLEFQGDTVSFFGDVATKQGDTEVRADRLDLKLNRAVDFSSLTPAQFKKLGDEPLDINILTFRHNVVVSSKEWEGTVLQSLRTANLAELSFNTTTQWLRGLGPGEIRQWTREDDEQVAADFGVAIKPYRLTKVEFDGEITGHAEQRWLRLTRSVQALSGLVARPLADLSRDELLEKPGQPMDAFWVRCNTLGVEMNSQSPDDKLDVTQVRIQAVGRVELEGRQFRAIADMANVDRTTGLMTIRGDGGNHASLWWQEIPGKPASTIRARSIRVNPVRRTYEVDEAAGFWGGR